ncbi:hypothetical protein [Pectobacterium brasiliense]|uniref:hypothetical protein n=1 Tax=Pectobacterium brasiliense TaxID=180957 RepID=UPI00057EC223|nr:hypothetical protein [Pectobacterium brasiliense]KHT21019.1 hypothetical protein RC97_02920 [Pectobacterium brasiliense]
MFGLSKKERLSSLRKQLEDVMSQARHTYDMKSEAESRAFYDIVEIAREKGISAAQAAKTGAGIRTLSEVVLNRQYAFFLNETAIQLHAEIRRINEPNYFDINNKNQWFDEIVSPVGSYMVIDQIEDICGSMIRDVEEYINPSLD